MLFCWLISAIAYCSFNSIQYPSGNANSTTEKFNQCHCCAVAACYCLIFIYFVDAGSFFGELMWVFRVVGLTQSWTIL